MRPLDLSAVTISHPSACAAASARSKVAAGGFGSVTGARSPEPLRWRTASCGDRSSVLGVPALGDNGLECRRVFEIRRQVVFSGRLGARRCHVSGIAMVVNARTIASADTIVPLHLRWR